MSTKGDPDRQGAGGRVSPTAPESASLSAAVWNYLESIPGFNEELRQSEAAARSRWWRLVRGRGR